MQPLRIRIDRIVDFGMVVSLVGVDTQTGMAVSIHVDHRPFSAFRKALREAGLPRPIEYEADRLLLHLDLLPAGDAEGVQPVELNGCGATRAQNDQHPIQELDR